MATTSSSMATRDAAAYAQELQALKTELQRTLARLEAHAVTRNAPSANGATSAGTGARAGASSTAEMPSLSAEAQRLILQELVATARQRRRAEMRLVREMQRVAPPEIAARSSHSSEAPVERPASSDNTHSRETDHGPQRQRTSRHRTRRRDDNQSRRGAARAEIASLRERRQQILQQIENDSHARRAAPSTSSSSSSSSSPDNSSSSVDGRSTPLSPETEPVDPHEYSIEGIVRLAPLHDSLSSRSHTTQTSRHRNKESQTTTTTTTTTAAAAASKRGTGVTSLVLPTSAAPRHRLAELLPPSDTLQDVFSLQLKFAETMLQLEKSIQARDRLLGASQPPPPLSSITSSSYSQRRRPAASRRVSRSPVPDHELSDSSALFDDEDDSLESATDHDHRRHSRRRYRTPMTAHASTAANRTTPSTGGSTAPSSATPDSQPSPPQLSVPSDEVFRTPEQLRPSVPTRPSKSSHKRGGGALKPLDEEREVNQLSVSECVTPLMVNLAAAQKATPDSSKQVRFHTRESEYPTPLVARNISFSHESMDSSSEADSMVRASGYARRSFAAHADAGTASAPQQLLQQQQQQHLSDDEPLSFMDDTSVASEELSDESFIRSFQALRREVRRDEGLKTPVARRVSPEVQRAARDEDQEEDDEDSDRLIVAILDGDNQTEQDPQETTTESLRRRRREVVLSIQERTAAMLLQSPSSSSSSSSTQRKRVALELERLRRELHAIDASLVTSSS